MKKRSRTKTPVDKESRRLADQLKASKEKIRALGKELKESEEQYKTLVENANTGIYRNTAGAKGRFLYANSAMVKMFGYRSLKEILEINVSDLYQDSSQRKLFSSAIEKRGFVKNKELRLRKKDGTPIWCLVTAKVNRGKSGSIRWIDGFIEDITAHKNADEELKNSKEHLDNIINALADPIFVKDRQHRWILLNDAFCEFMGYSREELIGKSDHDFFPKEEAEVFWDKDEEVFRTGKDNVNEEKFTDRDQITHTLVTKKSLYTDNRGNEFIVGIIRDFTDRKRFEEKLRKLATRDSLTGILNRAAGLFFLEKMISLSKRKMWKSSLCYIDVNGFKDINDQYGHAEGDQLLIALAKILQAPLRETDGVCRLGGDEFLLILPQTTLKQARDIVLKRLLKKTEDFNRRAKKPYKISYSCGLSEYDPASEKTLDQLLEIADTEMYKNKR